MAQNSSLGETTSDGAPKLSLGARLLKLRDPLANLKPEETQDLSLEQHGELKISFGTKMKGRTFLECVESEPDWTKWLVEHYQSSTKPCHQIFIQFVEKYVSQAESIEAELKGEPNVVVTAKTPRVVPASKAAPKARPKTTAVDEDAVWELMGDPGLPDQVALLSSRMTQMEQVMQEMIGAIRQMNGTPSSS